MLSFVGPPGGRVDLITAEMRDDDLVALVEQAEIHHIVDCPKQRRRQKLARDFLGEMNFSIEAAAQMFNRGRLPIRSFRSSLTSCVI